MLCTINIPREILIAIGLTSGLGSVAYSVLEVSTEPEVICSEVMPGPRKKRGVSHWRRYNAHRLILSTVFERWPPTVISLGPPSTDDEPPEWVAFMRTAIFGVGQMLRVPVLLFDTDQRIGLALGSPDLRRGNGLKSLIRRQLPTFDSNKKRVVMATAAAMAGAFQVANTLSREERAI